MRGGSLFRLLDPHVGWDARNATGLTGFTEPSGLRLATTDAALDRQELLPWFPDRRLAFAGGWFLRTRSGLLRLDAGDTTWRPVWLAGLASGAPEAAMGVASGAPEAAMGVASSAPETEASVTSGAREGGAVAAAGHWIGLAGRGGVHLWWREGEQLAAHLPHPGALLALTESGDAHVVRGTGTDVWHYRPGGAPAGVIRTGLPGRIEGLRTGPGRTLWLLVRDDSGLSLWRSTGRDRSGPFVAAGIEEVAAALRPSGLVATDDSGFQLDRIGSFDWDGAPAPAPPRPAPALVTDGELHTLPIDSGLPRCRWHRVSLSADVPPAAGLGVAVTVTEDGVAPETPADWQAAPPGARDLLVRLPPGRFLHLRLRLTGDGAVTPVVRRIRLDFPRTTSAELLPPAFLSDRENPAADDFTQRFLALFDTTVAGVDRVIERYPALLDPAGVPDRVLPWLGGLLGLAFEAGWGAGVRRELLAAAPRLYRRRGTPWAVREAVRIVLGVRPDLVEQAAGRSWLRLGGSFTEVPLSARTSLSARRSLSARTSLSAGVPQPTGVRPSVGDGALGGVRLFGRSAARFRVGTSALSSAPLRSDGDPVQDPLTADAYRFRVVLPASAAGVDAEALRRLVTAQAPAHTRAGITLPGPGWVVGLHSVVGVDTAFTVPPPTVIGKPLAGTVLAPSRRGQRTGVVVGGAVGDGVAW
ncbi:phage tail protein [Actinoplanes sp. NBRC 101535]|uniref:phage tail protein n=1 Tax=Actinoplanes sp. NBRC 101535 TaxID=3032196 RepID=UPI0024A11038|nr:phage tail protein [Actinoplanes sp. NBRC 101535]GLY05337.1 hypothetical protein Acsp01_57160 [Actinoplanes sp. NBRC 101535]